MSNILIISNIAIVLASLLRYLSDLRNSENLPTHRKIRTVKDFINSTNLVRASISALTKISTNTFIHNARTRYMLLNLVAKLDTNVQ